MQDSRDTFALDVTGPQMTAADMTLAQNVGESLNKHYPGHLWAVDVPTGQGVVHVRDLTLSGKWGITLKVSDIYSMSELDRLCMKYGGELLERYKIDRRKAANRHQVDEQINALPVDFAGNHRILM